MWETTALGPGTKSPHILCCSVVLVNVCILCIIKLLCIYHFWPVSGVLTNYLNLISPTQVSCLSLCLAPTFLVRCDDDVIAGVTVPYPSSPDLMTLTSSCNSDCACSTEVMTPVCVESGMTFMTYFSPCHAGCHVHGNDSALVSMPCIMCILALR